MPVFNSPLMLGFDHLERVLDHVSKSSAEGYPPYNIEQISEHSLRITLAVAGFVLDDLSVTLEANQLVVRGRKKDDDAQRVFLYRGIAARQFQKSFVIAEGIEVEGASLDNGLLNIDLRRRIPEAEIRTIKISRGAEPQVRTPAPTRIELSAGPSGDVVFAETGRDRAR